jgi:hypothetical protein
MAAAQSSSSGYLSRPEPSGLADVIDLILDKGLVIDLYVRVSLIGIEILTIDARIVVASVDTYLRFAEAVGRLNIEKDEAKEDLPGLMQDMTRSVSRGKTGGALDSVKEKFEELVSDDDEEQEQEQEQEAEPRPARQRRRRTREREAE